MSYETIRYLRAHDVRWRNTKISYLKIYFMTVHAKQFSPLISLPSCLGMHGFYAKRLPSHLSPAWGRTISTQSDFHPISMFRMEVVRPRAEEEVRWELFRMDSRKIYF